MAQPAYAREPNSESRLPEPERRPPKLSVAAPVNTDIEAQADRPLVGIHRGAIEIALAAAIWFVVAMYVLFVTNNAFVNYTLVVMVGFAVVFFTLTLSLASRAAGDARWADGARTSFSEFIHGTVDIRAGTIAGREALVQITMLPITLAAGATAIGIIFRAGW